MKNSLRTKLAAVTITAAALIGAPAVAHAYTPSTGGGSFTVAPGGSVSIPFTGFQPGEMVRFSLVGENASGATLASIVRAAVETKSFDKAAAADGSTTVTVTLPSNASGEYTLAAAGLDSGAASSVTITAAAGAGDGSGLPNTGGDPASLAGVWIGGGALLAAGVAVTAVSVSRRKKQDA